MLNKIFAILCIAFSTASLPAWSITNIESQKPGPPDNGLHGSFKLGLSGKSGDQKKEIYNLGTKITWRNDNDIVLTIAEANYGVTNEIKDTDDRFLHLRWTHLFGDSWGGETFAQRENNEFTNLESRYLIGAGGRYELSQDKKTYSFVLGFGAMREREALNLQTVNEINWAWRWNTFYSYKHQLNQQVFFANTAYIQPQIGDLKSVRALMNIGLSVKLTNALSVQLDYKITHNSKPAFNPAATPAIDGHKTNSEYITSIVYNF